LADERKDAVVNVGAIDPIKSLHIVIAVPESGFVAVKFI
jgi:hypothetical protein